MNVNFSEILTDFVALLYPNICEGCHRYLVKGEVLICTYCLADLPRCNYQPDTVNPVVNRFKGRLNLQEAHAFLRFNKKGKVQRLLHALKYKHRPEIAHKLGVVFGAEMKESGFLGGAEVIIPVPLHVSRERQRGYNQSEAWANGLSAALEIPVETRVVKRVLKTSTQTRRGRLNRWENMQGVFQVSNAERIRDRHVLLVDDVMTTGATLEACGQVLLDAGSRALSVACIAFAQ